MFKNYRKWSGSSYIFFQMYYGFVVNFINSVIKHTCIDALAHICWYRFESYFPISLQLPSILILLWYSLRWFVHLQFVEYNFLVGTRELHNFINICVYLCMSIHFFCFRTHKIKSVHLQNVCTRILDSFYILLVGIKLISSHF